MLERKKSGSPERPMLERKKSVSPERPMLERKKSVSPERLLERKKSVSPERLLERKKSVSPERLKLQKISPELYDKAWRLMLDSFPSHEMRAREAQWELVDHPNFCPDAIVVDGQFAGVIFYWLFDGLCFVEHFATDSRLRGRGIGATAIETLVERYPLTVLEIDPVVDEISQRREKFYQRCGFVTNPYQYFHTGYAPDFTTHPLVVMSAPRILTPKELKAFKAFNFDTVCKL